MHLGHDVIRAALDRRTFLVAGGVGFCGLSLPGQARAVILLWPSGGPSQIDTWDPKPDAPAGHGGEFRPVVTSAPGVRRIDDLEATDREGRPFRLPDGGAPILGLF